MLRPGWTDGLLKAALLAVAAVALASCGTVGAPTGAIAAGELPSPQLQATYDSLLARVQSGDAAALADLGKFSAAHPDLAGPLVTLGLERARAGDEAAAADYLQRATTVCTRCGPAWSELGVLSRRQGRFADAERAYLRAIELQPGYAPAYYNLAVLYELYIPRPELALENYERYLQLGGDGAGADGDVEKWAVDLRRRVGDTPKTARTEPAT